MTASSLQEVNKTFHHLSISLIFVAFDKRGELEEDEFVNE